MGQHAPDLEPLDVLQCVRLLLFSAIDPQEVDGKTSIFRVDDRAEESGITRAHILLFLQFSGLLDRESLWMGIQPVGQLILVSVLAHISPFVESSMPPQPGTGMDIFVLAERTVTATVFA